ncbi:ribosomal RNA small subunit methyltransferase G [Bacteroidia bacterium]|nr:ribosomal RNA small subunit methyltransferase G [Bacteroidia bacterium]
MYPSADLVTKYFPDISELQRQQFAQLSELYTDWNARINLISRKDIAFLYERHVLHSLAIAKCVTFAPSATVLDVGTGGGFPGIPLAILFPHTHFTLVDSIGKKIMVVKEIATSLPLQNVTALQARVEDLRTQFDFVVSRAVTDLPTFLSWVWSKTNNGVLYLKGGDLAEELSSVCQKVQIFDISAWFSEPFFETKKVICITATHSATHSATN